MSEDTPPRRWVVVVRPDRLAVLPRLGLTFHGTAWVEVLVDRRRGERRQRRVPRELDQRSVDRRGVPGDRTQTSSYRLAYRGDGFDVYEATAPVSARCPECGVTVMVEMPRFGEPPARLEVRVVHERIHVQHQDDYVRHVVEIQSFGPGGRPLVATQSVARPRVDVP